MTKRAAFLHEKLLFFNVDKITRLLYTINVKHSKTLGIEEVIDIKLSTKGRYGLMAMYELANVYGNGPMSLRKIAEKQELSDNYLEQLFALLRKSGLINSVRGSQGGYMLSRPPREITVGSILRSLEGSLAPADCVGDHDTECCKDEGCATKLVLIKIKDSIDEVVDSISLEDMLNDN